MSTELTERLSDIIERIDNENIIDLIQELRDNSDLLLELFNQERDILGKIYERSLETENKARGIFYTPLDVVRYVVKNTVGKHLDDMINQVKNATVKQDHLGLITIQKQISSTKILDPACGTGGFLIEAFKQLLEKYEYLQDYLSNRNQRFEREKLAGVLDSENLNLNILRRHIYGIDIDTKALQILKFNHLIEVLKKNNDISKDYIEAILDQLDENITNANSITRKFNGKFDIIIGNPPYVSWSDIGEYRRLLESKSFEGCEYECRPNHSDSQPNLYLFFLIKSINLLKQKGMIGFILPQEWLFHHKAANFRDHVINNSGRIMITKFPSKTRLFKHDNVIGTNSMVFLSTNDEQEDFIQINITSSEKNSAKKALQQLDILDLNSSVKNSGLLNISIENKKSLIGKRWKIQDDFIQALRTKFENLDVISLSNKKYFQVMGGFQPPIRDSINFLIKEPSLSELNELERNHVFPCIYDASRIQRYHLEMKDQYWIILNGVFESVEGFKEEAPNLYHHLNSNIKKKEERWWEFPNVRNLDVYKNVKKKILTARTSKSNSFAIDERKHIIKGTNTAIISLKHLPEYVLGILNSKLAEFWYQKFGYGYHGGKSKKYEPEKIKMYMIPIINQNGSIQTELAQLVIERINLAPKKNQDTIKLQKIEKEIDRLVFKLYSISKAEKNVILEKHIDWN